jgi:tetratricopeptide (TPR) repeat protein
MWVSFSLAAAILVLAAAPAQPAPTAPAKPPAAGTATATDLQSLLERYAADNLVAPLRQFENEHGRGPEGAEAALLLGRLHFARGEYLQAAGAFSRAAARLDPTRKHEARYWAGLSWLAMKEPNQARAALEEVAVPGSPRRADAMLGVALAWELAGRPDRAFDQLESLLEHEPGEAAPAALERQIALAERLRKPGVAERARARLIGDYPHRMEAARAASPTAESPAGSGAGGVAVQLGAFSSASRARSLVNAAHRAGFKNAEVVTRGEGSARLYVVRLGVFPTTGEARKMGEQAGRSLGVTYRLEPAP